MSKGERMSRCRKIERNIIGLKTNKGSDSHRGSIVLRYFINVFASMPKGDIVEILVFIDVKP
jgi:hypothetical protein